LQQVCETKDNKKKNNEKIISLLLKAKADPNLCDDEVKVTPLAIASSTGQVNVMKLLIDKKAEIDLSNSKNETPLHQAVCNKQLDVVKFLLESKANIESNNQQEETPLWIAISTNDKSIVQYLIDQKANINHHNLGERTILHALASNDNIQLASEFLSIFSSKISIDSKDIFGATPLMLAAENGSINIIPLLLESKANIESEDLKGNTPLMYAATRNQIDVIKFFLKQRIPTDSKNKNGETAYSIALNKGFKEVSDLLLGKVVSEEELDSILKINAGGRSDFQFLQDFGNESIEKIKRPNAGLPV